MKALKITNPLYVGALAEAIRKYHDRTKQIGMSYETLYAYFTNSVQFGRDLAEFWVAYDDEDKPAGFAHWFVMGAPHISKVHCDHFSAWAKDKKVTDLLCQEFFAFGVRKNALLYDTVVPHKGVYAVFQKVIDRLGYDVLESERIHFLMRKRS